MNKGKEIVLERELRRRNLHQGQREVRRCLSKIKFRALLDVTIFQDGLFFESQVKHASISHPNAFAPTPTPRV